MCCFGTKSSWALWGAKKGALKKGECGDTSRQTSFCDRLGVDSVLNLERWWFHRLISQDSWGEQDGEAFSKFEGKDFKSILTEVIIIKKKDKQD